MASIRPHEQIHTHTKTKACQQREMEVSTATSHPSLCLFFAVSASITVSFSSRKMWFPSIAYAFLAFFFSSNQGISLTTP
mmetsp:Transcript_43358/g.92173  ORF Transcript_43358/g.92173 Transcript_43358/m.92173 type:complete len:80 (+) Transcript_43358:286-525(+)